MAKLTNDVVVAFRNAIVDAIVNANKAESATAATAYHLSVLLGDPSRSGFEVVPTITWAKSDAALKDVQKKLHGLCEVDADTISGLVKEADKKKAITLRDDARAKRGMIDQAAKLLGAMAILAERTDDAAEWKDGRWSVPASWYVDANKYEVARHPRTGLLPMLTFKSRSGTDPVSVIMTNSDGGEEQTMVSVQASVATTIKAAYAPATRQGSRAAGDTAKPADAAAPADSMDGAVDMLSKAIAGPEGDYTATFSDKAADAMGTLIASIAHNDSLWELALAERDAVMAQRAADATKVAVAA